MNKLLSSFPEHLKVAIVGSSGGIGRALTRALSDSEQVEHVFCFSRSSGGSSSSDGSKISHISMDITDEDSVIDAVTNMHTDALDLVIVTTGVLHSDGIAPEKSLGNVNFAQMQAVFAVNTFGPILVAKHFLPKLSKTSKSAFAALSARVGSIEDNRLGGWYSYRASKSALNMMLKNAAIETARRNKKTCIIGLHPGTVDTGLSKPFQKNVEQSKLFTAEFSAGKLLEVLDGIDPSFSGKTLAWDGQIIPY